MPVYSLFTRITAIILASKIPLANRPLIDQGNFYYEPFKGLYSIFSYPAYLGFTIAFRLFIFHVDFLHFWKGAYPRCY